MSERKIKIDRVISSINRNNSHTHISIAPKSGELPEEVANIIHNQLVGNQDYIDSRIVLDFRTNYPIVELSIFDDCENDVSIEI